MARQQVRITFQPTGRTIHILPGTTILEAAAQVGLTIETPCGGQGTCGKCRVRITQGKCPPTAGDENIFSPDELAEGWRLACQTAIRQAVAIDVPASSLFASGHQILTATAGETADEIVPAVRKIYVELDKPTLDDNHADLLRLEQKIGPVKVALDLVRRLSRHLQEWGYKGTAVITDHHLIDFQQGDTTEACYGAAFDVGTTTVVGSLLDLNTGDEIALASAMNPQVSFGDDVLSRIEHSSVSPANLAQLRQAIIETVSGLLDSMCVEAQIARQDVYELSFAGNTTMEHLLCGINVEPLGKVPFVPAYARALALPVGQLGIVAHPQASAYVFPIIGGFVGGDTVGCMLATRLAEQDGPSLLVDIGTNGEIVLAHNGKLLAASTAAGPAFEGARISCGMRATTGAIDKIAIGDDLQYNVIGNVDPIGMCGSSLVDLCSQLLTAGVIASTGRLLPPDELPEKLPKAIADRVSIGEADQPQFLVADEGARPVVLTQKDVRELQLASGAIRAGIGILLKRAGVEPGQLKRVLLAGAFASFIRRSHAQRLGLLPGEIDHEVIQYVGNASLSGARWALLSTNARHRAESYARDTEHVELSQDMNFQMAFADAMIFPDK